MLEQIMNNDDGGPTDPLPTTPRSEKSPTGRIRAIPPAFKSIQVNGCNTPGCDNFGVPPTAGPVQIGRGPSADGYAIIGTGSVDLACKKCRKYSSLKSNYAIQEELQRQGELIWADTGMRCPDPACTSRTIATGFRKFGTTGSGSARFQCLACKKTLSVGKSTLRQRQPHKNEQVFKLLLNKMPFNRMREVADLSVAGLYGKIDFIYQQCLAFAGDRERRLASMATFMMVSHVSLLAVGSMRSIFANPQIATRYLRAIPPLMVADG